MHVHACFLGLSSRLAALSKAGLISEHVSGVSYWHAAGSFLASEFSSEGNIEYKGSILRTGGFLAKSANK